MNPAAADPAYGQADDAAISSTLNAPHIDGRIDTHFSDELDLMTILVRRLGYEPMTTEASVENSAAVSDADVYQLRP